MSSAKRHAFCMAPLLQHGIPRHELIEAVVQDTDEQLADNQRQLEECIREIGQMSNDLTEGGERCCHPVDAINNVIENGLLEKTTCYDLDPIAVSKLLTYLIEVLETRPGSEERVLQQLLRLSSQDGFLLPFRNDFTESTSSQSLLSINTAVDESDHVNDSLWGKLTMKLKRYFSDRLSRMTTSRNGEDLDRGTEQRIRYVQALCSLYATKQAWAKYCSLRCQQVATCVGGVPDDDSRGFCEAVGIFQRSLSYITAMIDEDVRLFNAGVFSDISTPDAIRSIYVETLADVATTIAQTLEEELEKAARSPLSSTKRDATERLRRTSLVGPAKKEQDLKMTSNELTIIGHLLLEKLPAASWGAEGPSHAMAGMYLGVVVRFVCAMSQLEEYIDGMRDVLVLEDIATSRKLNSRRNLKSALKRTSRKQLVPRGTEETGSSQGSAKFATEIATPTVVSRSMSCEGSGCRWQESFARMAADIAGCMKVHVKGLTDRLMTEEQEKLRQNGTIDIVEVAGELRGGRHDYPGTISKCTQQLMTELDSLLQLAAVFSGQSSDLHLVRSAFVDSVKVNLGSLAAKMTDISSQVNRQVAAKTLYILLSDAAYIRNQLAYYETELSLNDTSGGSKPVLLPVYRQFCDLVDDLSGQVIEYQGHLLSTKLLQDAESNDWQSTNHFYEDERCSFTVQMWHLHISSLRHDLWQCCPPVLAQSMFASVLSDSLLILAHRYAQGQPSYKRVNQFRNDITSLLLCTSEHLFAACDSPRHLLSPSPCQEQIYSIHNSCLTLLSSLAVVTSPLEQLYKVFKKGFQQRKSPVGGEVARGHIGQWLAWIRPRLLPLHQSWYQGLQTTSALYIHLRLVFSQPERNHNMLVQAVLMKDYTLPIMLLTQTARQWMDGQTDSPTDSQTDSPASPQYTFDDIFTSFLDVLLACSDFSDAVTKVLVPIIDRTDTWKLFDVSKVLGKTDAVPPWIQAVCNSLSVIINRSVQCAVGCLLEPVKTSNDDHLLGGVLTELPCGCEMTSETDPPMISAKDEEKALVSEAMYAVVSQLVSDIYTVPAALVTFFKTGQRTATERGVQTPHDCLGLKIIATGIRTRLLQVAASKSDHSERLEQLAECTYHVLTSSNYGRGSGTPRAASHFIKTNRNWLLEQVETITDHLSNPVFELVDRHPLEDDVTDYTENYLLSLTSSILHSSSGEMHLTKVYNYLHHNLDWVLSQLDIAPLLGEGSSAPVSSLRLSTGGKTPEASFNPLAEYRRIGDCSFDHKAIADFSYDWSRLLCSDLGLSESGMRNLLSHRDDIQNSSYLSETEQKHINTLKTKFHL